MERYGKALRIFRIYQETLNGERHNEEERQETLSRCKELLVELRGLGYNIDPIRTSRLVPHSLPGGSAVPVLIDEYTLILVPLHAGNKTPLAILRAVSRTFTPQFILFADYADIVQEDIDDPRLADIEQKLTNLGFSVIVPEDEMTDLEKDPGGTYLHRTVNIYLQDSAGEIVSDYENVPVVIPLTDTRDSDDSLVLPIDAAFSEFDREFLQDKIKL